MIVVCRPQPASSMDTASITTKPAHITPTKDAIYRILQLNGRLVCTNVHLRMPGKTFHILMGMVVSQLYRGCDLSMFSYTGPNSLVSQFWQNITMRTESISLSMTTIWFKEKKQLKNEMSLMFLTPFPLDWRIVCLLFMNRSTSLIATCSNPSKILLLHSSIYAIISRLYSYISTNNSGSVHWQYNYNWDKWVLV